MSLSALLFVLHGVLLSLPFFLLGLTRFFVFSLCFLLLFIYLFLPCFCFCLACVLFFLRFVGIKPPAEASGLGWYGVCGVFVLVPLPI
jgi:hypothetical protein